MPHAFISYNDDVQDIAENLKERLKSNGVTSWIFSRDRTYGSDSWHEITDKIMESTIILFIISRRTVESIGQIREYAIAKENHKSLFPIITEHVDFSDFPSQLTELRRINGFYLDHNNIQSRTLEIVQTFFPELSPSETPANWKYPKPGDWLEVCHIDEYMEKEFKLIGKSVDIGDEVYFRRISPIGLFECYVPQIKELFWFWPPNLKPSTLIDEDRSIERELVPHKYTTLGLFEIERRGWDSLKREGKQ
jgi:hypothetical protein